MLRHLIERIGPRKKEVRGTQQLVLKFLIVDHFIRWGVLSQKDGAPRCLILLGKRRILVSIITSNAGVSIASRLGC